VKLGELRKNGLQRQKLLDYMQKRKQGDWSIVNDVVQLSVQRTNLFGLIRSAEG
jgi:hypothetical protein